VSTAGIYIHVPFCRRKCAYCGFHSITDLSRIPAFLKALAREIALAEPGDLAFDTIYIGGGTPSLLAPGDIARVLSALRARFRFAGPVETTLEANPGTLTPDRLAGYRAAGVNRLNIGVQSLDPRNLEFLGRIHSAAEALQAIEWARAAGFDNLGIDLIYGIPGQGRNAWRQELAGALAFDPEHISAYMLSLEPGTPLERRRRAGRFQPAPEAEVAGRFLLTSEYLEAHGYRHYEISNFARRTPGAEGDARMSRHNSKYWSYAPYRGFGPAAHSFLPPRRFWNLKDVGRYAAALEAGRIPTAGGETLTLRQQVLEAMMLGLRTADGIVAEEFGRRFGIDFDEAFGPAAKPLASEGLLTVAGGRLAPTRRGMLFHDSVAAALSAGIG
jgi:oxygen-independent coproporphyrinogen-3 oxidase